MSTVYPFITDCTFIPRCEIYGLIFKYIIFPDVDKKRSSTTSTIILYIIHIQIQCLDHLLYTQIVFLNFECCSRAAKPRQKITTISKIRSCRFFVFSCLRIMGYFKLGYDFYGFKSALRVRKLAPHGLEMGEKYCEYTKKPLRILPYIPINNTKLW